MNLLAENVILAAFIAFCRIGGCFLMLPGLSSVRVPMQVRLFMAVAVTAALLAHLWGQILPVVDRRPEILAPMIVSELIVGALIGLMARLFMLALQFMGAAISMMVGYGGVGGSAIEEAEPQGPLGAMISFAALLLLFVFDFHHQIVRALVDSYRIAPVSSFFGPQAALVDLADTMGEAFLLVLRLGSPFVAYAILINLTIGFVNKLTPQIPVYFISQPFVIAGGLVILYLSAGTLLTLFADAFMTLAVGR